MVACGREARDKVTRWRFKRLRDCDVICIYYYITLVPFLLGHLPIAKVTDLLVLNSPIRLTRTRIEIMNTRWTLIYIIIKIGRHLIKFAVLNFHLIIIDISRLELSERIIFIIHSRLTYVRCIVYFGNYILCNLCFIVNKEIGLS